jgi:hypothetical protein
VIDESGPHISFPNKPPLEEARQNMKRSTGRFWMECTRVEDGHKKAGSYTELDSGPIHNGRIRE